MYKPSQIRHGKFQLFLHCLPTRIAIEKSYKHVAIMRLLHAMIPSLLAAIFSRFLIDPDFKNRLTKNSYRLNFCF